MSKKPDFTWRLTNRKGKGEIEIGDWPAPSLPPGVRVANLDDLRMRAIGEVLIKTGTQLLRSHLEDEDGDVAWEDD